MSDQKLCENCLAPLCAYDLSCLGAHMDAVDEHHLDATPANDLCTRPPVVKVTGCNTGGETPCLAARVYTWQMDAHCVLDDQKRKVSHFESSAPPPDWCPALKGIVLKAEIPAKEEG